MRNITAVSKVIQHITNGVKKGSYVSGQRLVEAELSAVTGIGRSPVREALRILSGEGVVDLIPNKGARLREMTREDFINFVNATAALLGVGLDLAVEALGNPRNARKVRTAYQAIIEVPAEQRVSDFMDAIFNFHLTLHEITGNAYLNKFMRRLHFERLMAELERTISREAIRTYQQRYDALFAALMACDRVSVTRIWTEQSTDILNVR